MQKSAAVFARALMPLFEWLGARIFIAGCGAHEVIEKARAYIAAGYAVSLNSLIEHVSDPSVVERNVREVIDLIALMKAEHVVANLAIKPSSIGSEVDIGPDTPCNEGLFEENLFRILNALASSPIGVGVEIDAEGYTRVDGAWRIACALRAVHTQGFRVRLALQMHIRDLDVKVSEAMRNNIPLRIVKGAPTYADPDMLRTLSEEEIEQRAFSVFCVAMDNRIHPYAAVALNRRTALVYAKIGERYRGAGKSPAYTIQMLYGLGRPLALQLRALGAPVSVYMTYLPAWADKKEAKGYIARRFESGIVLMLRTFSSWWTKKRFLFSRE